MMNRFHATSPVLIASLPQLTLPSPAHAQDPTDSSGRGPLSSTKIEVSSRRVRVTFPLDTAGPWAWQLYRCSNFDHGSLRSSWILSRKRHG